MITAAAEAQTSAESEKHVKSSGDNLISHSFSISGGLEKAQLQVLIWCESLRSLCCKCDLFRACRIRFSRRCKHMFQQAAASPFGHSAPLPFAPHNKAKEDLKKQGRKKIIKKKIKKTPQKPKKELILFTLKFMNTWSGL